MVSRGLLTLVACAVLAIATPLPAAAQGANSGRGGTTANAAGGDLSSAAWHQQRSGAGGRSVNQDVNEAIHQGIAAVPDCACGPPVLDAEQLAASHVHLPAAAVHLSPQPPIPQLTQLRTFMWIDGSQWQTVTGTATAGPVSATVTGTPTAVVWDMGDGHRVVCNGPGTPYNFGLPEDAQDTSCSYVYKRSSGRQPDQRYHLTATIVFHATWTVQGAPGGGDLGPAAGPSATLPVCVEELHAINVYPGSPPQPPPPQC